MSEQQLPSSDDSDEDYVPADNTAELSEELESGPESDPHSDTEQGGSRSKKTKKKRKRTAKSKVEEEEEKEPEEKKSKINPDDVWADFKKDVDDKFKQSLTKKSQESKVEESKSASDVPEKTEVKKPAPRTIPQRKPGGLGSVLGQLGKKDKVSTLEKSKLDWENFKKSRGLCEEIQTHNRGKDGYLERQDFLQRTDLRRFEIEKTLRATNKRN